MSLNSHLTIEGEYTVDVYRKDGTLSYSLGPHKNFITSTGLSFPSKYAFADCFRYLSLGDGTSKNTIKTSVNNGWGTINLDAPLEPYTYIGGRGATYDFDHSTSQYSSASFHEYDSGVSITRGWRVPIGTDLFPTDHTIHEVMLSPGRPNVTGISINSVLNGAGFDFTTMNGTSLTDTSQTMTAGAYKGYYIILTDDNSIVYYPRLITNNSVTVFQWSAAQSFFVDHARTYSYTINPTFSLCSSDQTDTDINVAAFNGLEYSPIASYYDSLDALIQSDICEATGAFVRIVKDILLSKDNYMIFNYTLFINVNTGRYDFTFDMASSSRNTRGANRDNNWWVHPTSGRHNLIHHGVKVINHGDPTTFAPWGAMNQIPSYDTSTASDFGESLVPSWGSPLEPSTPEENLNAYVTTDNLQFIANANVGGAFDSSVVPGFTQSGLMLWQKTPQSTTIANGQFLSQQYNIRLPNCYPCDADTPGAGSRVWPLPSDYTTETTTPETDFNYTPLYFFPRTVTAVAFDPFADPSVRNRSVKRNFQFVADNAAADSFVYNPLRGIVLSYIPSSPGGDINNIPYLDCLFVGTGHDKHTVIIPVKDSPSLHKYSTGNYAGPEVYNTDPNPRWYWYYLDGGLTPGKLTFSFQETWSSPCNPDVDGC